MFLQRTVNNKSYAIYANSFFMAFFLSEVYGKGGKQRTMARRSEGGSAWPIRRAVCGAASEHPALLERALTCDSGAGSALECAASA